MAGSAASLIAKYKGAKQVNKHMRHRRELHTTVRALVSFMSWLTQQRRDDAKQPDRQATLQKPQSVVTRKNYCSTMQRRVLGRRATRSVTAACTRCASNAPPQKR
jgi:hypothetical protein